MALLITETITQVALESQVAIDITSFLHKSLRSRLRHMKNAKPASENVLHIRHDNSMRGEFCSRFSFNRMRRASKIGLIYWNSIKDDLTQRVSNFSFPDLLRGNSYNFMLLYLFGYKNDLVTAGMGLEGNCLSAFISDSQYSTTPVSEPSQMRTLFSEYQAADLSYAKPDFGLIDVVAPEMEAEIAPQVEEKKAAKKKSAPRKRKAKEAAKSEMPQIAGKFDCADTSFENASNFAANLVSEISTLISLEENIGGNATESTEAPTVLKLDTTREKVAVATKRGRKTRKNQEIIISAAEPVLH